MTRLIAGICLLFTCGARAGEFVAAPLIDFGVSGGWCWFQDERAIVDGDRFIFGSVSSPSGDINVTTYSLSTGKSSTVLLAERFQSDDHDAPALLKLADGRYLACFAKHGSDRLMRWRISARPGDASEWGPQQSLDVGASATYMNVYRLSAENGRIYNFHRGMGYNPNCLLSEDEGKSFGYGGRLVEWAANKSRHGSGRPYVRYASNGVDTIHFIMTEDHPHHFANSIYHGYVRAGKLHRSDGAVLGELSRGKTSPFKPTDFTRVFKGDAQNIAWTSDIRLDRDGRPYIAFSVGKENGDMPGARRGQDIRYWYGHWDGKQWNTSEMAHAGHRLYAAEWAYSGLVALHPGDANVVYISTSSDPGSGRPLISATDGQRHFEIYKGVTVDGAKTWKWTAITRDSSVENIRPICRVVDEKRAILLWQRGTYTTYTRFDVKVVGVIDEGLGK